MRPGVPVIAKMTSDFLGTSAARPFHHGLGERRSGSLHGHARRRRASVDAAATRVVRRARASAIMLVEMRGGLAAQLTRFAFFPRLFSMFGLASELMAD
jgi:hypothetical protein